MNKYYAWAINNQGASTDVAAGDTFASQSSIISAARREFGPGWTIHVMRIDTNNDGNNTRGQPSEIRTFRIR